MIGEPVTIDVNGQRTQIVAGIPPSAHKAARCRVSPGVRFSDDVWFSFSIADGAARIGQTRKGKVGFFVPRQYALPVAFQLYVARNALLHMPDSDPSLGGAETTAVDGVQVRVLRIDPPGWFRVSIIGPAPCFRFLARDVYRRDLVIDLYGLPLVDDAMSGFLRHFTDTRP